MICVDYHCHTCTSWYHHVATFMLAHLEGFSVLLKIAYISPPSCAWIALALPGLFEVCACTRAGIIGYALVDCVKCPAPLAVLVGGVCGVIGWAAHMH